MEGGFMAIYITMILLTVVAFVVISRWIFRINDIIERLDQIIELLGPGKQ